MLTFFLSTSSTLYTTSCPGSLLCDLKVAVKDCSTTISSNCTVCSGDQKPWLGDTPKKFVVTNTYQLPYFVVSISHSKIVSLCQCSRSEGVTGITSEKINIFHKNICYDSSLDQSHQDGSNDGLQQMFSLRNKKSF